MHAQKYYLLTNEQRAEIEAAYMDRINEKSLDLEKPYIFSGLLNFAETYIFIHENSTLSVFDIMRIMHPLIGLQLMADGVIVAVCEELLIVYETAISQTEELLKGDYDFKITDLEYSTGPANIQMIRIIYNEKEYII